MKIQANYYQLSTPQHRYDNNVNFSGVKLRSNHEILWAECSLIGQKLGLDTRKIHTMIGSVSENRRHFMIKLADYFNTRNWYNKSKFSEDVQHIINIFNLVKHPQNGHYQIVDGSKVPIDMLEELFKEIDGKQSLNFVLNVQRNILDGSAKSGQKILDMLQSANRKDYIANTNHYRSYLKLTLDDPEAIKKLDSLISSGEFNENTFVAKMATKEIQTSRFFGDALKPYEDELVQNYSKAGIKLMRKMSGGFLTYRKGLGEIDYKTIVEMYKTTTPKNVDIRIALIDLFRIPNLDKSSDIPEMKSLKNLFDKIDANENINSFIDKLIDEKLEHISIEELNTVVDVVPPKKGEIFHENVANLIRLTREMSKAERIKVLQTEIENPFYLPKYRRRNIEDMKKAGFDVGDGWWQTLKTKIKNQINIYRYKRVAKQDKDFVPVDVNAKQSINREKPVAAPIIEKPVIITKEEAPIIEKIIDDNPPKYSTTLPVKFVKSPKELPAIKKLRVKINVNDVIEQKLGEKTLLKQRSSFADGANVMRLKLLPEIFDSISATRVQQRAIGKRPNIANSDALKLYEKINGKNRKLVRYMLKQTNSEGNRIFTVKDIISTINKAEIEIAKNKKSNKDFKAADAKALYEQIFQSTVEEHGKLRRAKKK